MMPIASVSYEVVTLLLYGGVAKLPFISWSPLWTVNTVLCRLLQTKQWYQENKVEKKWMLTLVMFRFRLLSWLKPPVEQGMVVRGFSPKLRSSNLGQPAPRWSWTASKDVISLHVKKSCRTFSCRKEPSGFPRPLLLKWISSKLGRPRARWCKVFQSTLFPWRTIK